MSFNSELTVGVEVEFPKAPQSGDRMKRAGLDSDDIRHSMNSVDFEIPDGRYEYDGTVGLEMVSNRLPIESASGWVKEVISMVENFSGERYCPTSKLRGNTAGFHIHLSYLSAEEARELVRLSEEPEVQALVCSSVTDENLPNPPVFRGGRYCEMDYNEGRYSVVNRRGDGHYEWRLPEPQTIDKVDNILRVLDIFKTGGIDAAVDYANEKVESGETTSAERAKAIGIDKLEQNEGQFTAGRAPAEETVDFFESCYHDSSVPYIYRVDSETDDNSFYAFYSENINEVRECEEGIEIHPSYVFDAETLDRVEDEELAEECNEAIESHRTGSVFDEPTEAKKVLIEKI